MWKNVICDAALRVFSKPRKGLIEGIIKKPEKHCQYTLKLQKCDKIYQIL